MSTGISSILFWVDLLFSDMKVDQFIPLFQFLLRTAGAEDDGEQLPSWVQAGFG